MPSSSAQHAHKSTSSVAINDELFLDPMLGTPLNIFVESEVPYREQYVEAVTKHGGHVSPSYSSCLHIIVDPHSESGQSLYRQYAGKKGKLVLSYQWINECIQKNRLQLFADSWAGCRVSGKEPVTPRRTLEESPRVEHQHSHAGARHLGPQTQETRPRLQNHSAITQHPPTLQSVDRRQYASIIPQANESQRPIEVPQTDAAQGHRIRQARHSQPHQPPPPSASSQPDTRSSLHHNQQHVTSQITSPQQALQQPHTPQTQFTQPSSIHPSQTRTSQLLPVQTTPQLASSVFSYQVFATTQSPEAVASSTSAAVQAVHQHAHQHQQQPWQTPTPVSPQTQSQSLQHLPSRSQHLYNREPATAPTATSNWEHSPQFSQIQSQPSLEDIQPVYYDDQYQDDSWNETPARNTFYDARDTYDTQTTVYGSQQSGAYAAVPGPSTSSLQHAIQQQPAASSSDSMGGHDQSRMTSPAIPPVASIRERRSPSPDEPRGRKRTRAPPEPPKTLVINRKIPPLRSPTPPSRVVKSTYGGNLFTADDVEYLKRYIAYCQSQGLVLSLREICERIAVKAPHHTFYSWRRYCNKHQIRLGGYTLGTESRSPTPADGNQSYDEIQQNSGALEDTDNSMGVETGVFNAMTMTGDGPFTLIRAERMYNEQRIPYRSPSPPKALFRSTTGKGVAFTADDVSFLCKYLAYRKLQGQVDMVTFWKDVAAKAPHHSRASWMKYYRRHKHEINRADGDAPLPPPPEKKMRYSREDDILLARHFANKPEGTSDKIFQAFAQLYPHHPWKGWQEHYRIHKTKIDHILQEEEAIVQGTTMDPTMTPQLNGTGDVGVY